MSAIINFREVGMEKILRINMSAERGPEVRDQELDRVFDL
jgi:hypothetical protein